MTMKLRLTPILISVAITSLVLFGGWFIYNSVAMKDPIVEIAEQFTGVEDASVQIHDRIVAVDLTLNSEANIGEIVGTLRREGSNITRGKELRISVEDNSNPELDGWWSQVLFEVAEAMEARRYGNIPELLANHGTEGMTIDTSMDEEYVYVRIVEGENVKFALLERMPAMMGVWANE